MAFSLTERPGTNCCKVYNDNNTIKYNTIEDAEKDKRY